MEDKWEKILKFVRGANRPYIAYLYSTLFGGLAVYAFIKYGTENIAFAIVTGFIGVVGTIVGMLFGERAGKLKAEK